MSGARKTAIGVTVTVLVVLLALAAIFAFTPRPAARPLQGQIEATEVNVTAKVPGRVATLEVREGQRVTKGQLVATVTSPELEAKLAQAEAAREGAVATLDKAKNGAREEEIRAARSGWERARHAAELAEKTFHRLDRLQADGVVPMQRRDEAEAAFKTARDAEDAAKATLDMAVNGARAEDKEAARTMVARAEGAVAEVKAAQAELKLYAPADGEVVRRNVEEGELVGPGFPLVTIVELADPWLTVHLREDQLAGIAVGQTLAASVPAISARPLDWRVDSLAAQADFATFRATSAQSGFDVKTFELRARPVTPAEGLRPGMSVLIPWPRTR
jgi:HlyD family secretion protein